jgi:serine/threonine protein kinase
MSGITKLGKYQVRRELGKGAMGVVYEGHDPMIDRTVALKTIRAENLQGEDAQEQLVRFRRGPRRRAGSLIRTSSESTTSARTRARTSSRWSS